VKELTGHKECVWQLVFDSSLPIDAPGRKYLYSGSDDTTIKVWNLDTFECVRTLGRILLGV
jgi:WD40 repeat protein